MAAARQPQRVLWPFLAPNRLKGSLGGRACAERMTQEAKDRRASAGGTAVLHRYGIEFFSALGSKSNNKCLS